MSVLETPTQVQHPWRATVRTIVAVIAAIVITLFAVILAAAQVAPQLLEAIAALLPPEAYAVGAGIVGVIVVLAGTVTRLMAIPGFNEWLTKLSLSATPKPTPTEVTQALADQSAADARKQIAHAVDDDKV